LQNDGDEQIIFVILVEQLGENSGSKIGRSPNVERGKKSGHFQNFHDYFAL
jgi:hypothetical protein